MKNFKDAVKLMKVNEYEEVMELMGISSIKNGYVVTRNVSKSECPWLRRDIKKGEKFKEFNEAVYGCISKNGVAVDMDGIGVELPCSAVRRAQVEE